MSDDEFHSASCGRRWRGIISVLVHLPLQPFSEINVLALKLVQLSLKDLNAVVRHGLQLDECAHRVSVRDRPFQVFVLFLISDGENGRHSPPLFFDIEQRVKPALHPKKSTSIHPLVSIYIQLTL